MNKRKFGKTGEFLACSYLRKRGYRILARNYSSPIGEIDIIAEDDGVLVFIEVKTRRSERYGLPEEAINAKKKRKLINLALSYIKYKNLYDKEARFDVVSVLIPGVFAKKTIRLIKNAFCAEE